MHMKEREIRFQIVNGSIIIANEWLSGEGWVHELLNNPGEICKGPFDDKSWGHKNSLPRRQSIGLKDKNEKEIYEGDIVKFYERDAYWIFEVVYMPTKACYSLKGATRFMDVMSFQFDSKLTEFYSKEIEIIGNVYENAELMDLLKKKESA